MTPQELKNSILQLAIQGKLVEQRVEEGTGRELLEKILAAKNAERAKGKGEKSHAKSAKSAKVGSCVSREEIPDDEKPFDIPESWEWVRLGEICRSISDGDHQPPPQVERGIPFLVISNVSSGTIDFTNTRHVPESYYMSLSGDRIAEKDDILFTVTGSYGIPVKVETTRKFCFQRHIALLKPLIDRSYLIQTLKSPAVKLQCDAEATGTAQKTVGLKALRTLLIPLPPLAEQKRIVAKLEELLPLCERLKAKSGELSQPELSKRSEV